MTSSGPSSPTEAIDALLARSSDTAPPTSEAGAAVLIVLRPTPDDVEALLIERAHRPGDHASGQVGLPGGRTDPSDADLRATALRECHEEVGIGEGDLTGTPRFFGIETASAFSLRVGVFASAARVGHSTPFAKDRSEVADLFWLPSRVLLTNTPHLVETRIGLRPMDSAVYQGHVVWGFTRSVLRRFFHLETPATFATDPRTATHPSA